MSSIRVSVAQYAAGQDVDENLQVATKLIKAAGKQADLVVLPENAMYADPTKKDPERSHHEAFDGSFVTSLSKTASSAGVDVVVGITETSDQDRPFNTLVHINAVGETAGVYRKIHLYDAFGYRESDKIVPADITEPYVFELNGVHVGLLTCYDLRFPEITRWVVNGGADVVALPAAWAVGPAKELHWETLIRARAIENTIYFAASGQTGPHCTGQSMIADPMGTVVACAGEAGEEFVIAEVDTSRIASVRATNPSLDNRRFTISPIR
ncbi:carbon-nitrogen hydrolase family protein [Brevibacterium luteolum]|uniref:carbon-nitrogen hydrolase family protein n=1 Tax=Brevibacterium luteolum TaxID=199591 RepID=UPI001A9D6FCE|nr:carbon-nitrogen hydrolase family protein [Brevibacterium luteolum]MBU8579972.1 carbon-nitrogen hydrolase family protein [Brevibacterium luteolum]